MALAMFWMAICRKPSARLSGVVWRPVACCTCSASVSNFGGTVADFAHDAHVGLGDGGLEAGDLGFDLLQDVAHNWMLDAGYWMLNLDARPKD